MPAEARDLSSPRCQDQLWGLSSLYPIDAGGIYPGLRQPGRQANHSPPFGAEVKNE